MPEHIRAFIAVRIPPLPPLLEVLGALRGMDSGLKVVPPENLHLTLRFLGETPRATILRIHEALLAQAQSWRPFRAQVHGLGMFPHARRPSVLWAGLEPHDKLAGIAQRVNRVLDEVGVIDATGDEDRAFQAHVTLARVRRRPPADLARLYREQAQQSFGELMVRSVDIYASTLTPHGPSYAGLHLIRFGGG